MSLAGTQKVNVNSKIKWTHKEVEEQQIVTQAIIKNLESNTTKISVSETQTKMAGSLAHLCTQISGNFKKDVAITEVANELHPTPAVCGTPREIAKDFILTNENYNRSFYTGYLGIIDSKIKSANLFVNLRCMQIIDTKAFVFVGGGITEHSNTEAEWQETHNKLQTMYKVLQPLL